MLIDSHCHFNFSEFDGQRDVVLASCDALGVRAICIPAVDPKAMDSIIEIVDNNQSAVDIYFSIGLHPWWVSKVDVSDNDFLEFLASYVDHPKCIGIGECGLDWHKEVYEEQSKEPSRENQRQYFSLQVEFAKQVKKPLIIHSVKAHADVLNILKAEKPQAGGVVHAFSGSEEIAKAYVDLGFCLGVGGVISYPRAKKTITALQKMPIEALMLETDAPDMPLFGYQGEMNSPLFVDKVAERLADIRGESKLYIAEQTTLNCKRLFRI